MTQDPLTDQAVVALLTKMLEPTLLCSVVGVLLSLLATYVPKFNSWFASLEESYKQLIMLLLITLVVVIMGCINYTGMFVFLPPGSLGYVILVWSWIQALIANQGAHKISPKPKAVIDAKNQATINEINGSATPLILPYG